MRVLTFSDLYESASEPVTGYSSAGAIQSFADDAAFVTAKGVAAANGDVYYNTTYHSLKIYRNSAWEFLDQPGVVGTSASPTAIVAGTGVLVSSRRAHIINFIQGSGGAVDISVNPQIAAGFFVGQRLTLWGRSDTNTVLLEDGNGLSIDGPITMGADCIVNLLWNGTLWVEEKIR